MRTLATKRGTGAGRVRGSESGGALALALIVVISVAALGAASIQLSSAVSRRQARAVDNKRSFYMAEAGLTEGYAGLRIGKTGNVGSALAPALFGEGLFWVEATATGGQVELESTGMVGSGRAVLSMVLERGEESAVELGVFSSGALDIPVGAVIDGYDSSQGGYAASAPSDPNTGTVTDPTPTTTTKGKGKKNREDTVPVTEEVLVDVTLETGIAALPGRIGSNEGITIAGHPNTPTVVGADLTHGTEYSATIDTNVVHTGTIEAAQDARQLPPVLVPELTREPGVTHSTPTPLVVLPGEGGIEFIHVSPDAELVFQGPSTYVIGDLSLDAGASVHFDTVDGGVALYFTQGLAMAPQSVVTTSGQDPSQVTLQVHGDTTDPVRLEAVGSFYGVVYAPQAEVRVGSELQLYGALVADRLTFAGPPQLHFDQHLVEVAESLAVPKLVSWRILELADGVGGVHAADPFALLGVDKETLLKPSECHEDQVIAIKYYDHGDVLTTYEGLESGFDWNDVKEVVSLERDGLAVSEPLPHEGVPKETTPEEPAPQGDLVAMILQTDPILNSGILADALVAAAPLTDDVLTTAMRRPTPMQTGNLRDVLMSTTDLSDTVMIAIVDEAMLNDRDLVDTLVFHSPLSPAALDALMNRNPQLSTNNQNTILAAQ